MYYNILVIYLNMQRTQRASCYTQTDTNQSLTIKTNIMKTQRAMLKLDTKKRINRYKELLELGFTVTTRRVKLCGDIVIMNRLIN